MDAEYDSIKTVKQANSELLKMAREMDAENKRLPVADTLILTAAQLADSWHYGQTRKYGMRVPYIIHPIRVAGRISVRDFATPQLVAACYLHDVLEDTDCTSAQLSKIVGSEVTAYVWEVTNPSKGSTASRAERKQMDREHIANISREAKLIKLADRIDNLQDMINAPDDFLSLYLQESELLLDEALRGVDEIFELQYELTMKWISDNLEWRAKNGRRIRNRDR